MLQFIQEAVLYSFLAGVLAFLLLELFAPVLDQFTGKAVLASAVLGVEAYLAVALFVLGIGLVSGLYPAWFLSGFSVQHVI